MKIAKLLSTTLSILLSLTFISTTLPAQAAPDITTEEARAIAKEAYIYGFPLVDSYRVMHAYFIDSTGPDYKGPLNTLASFGRVFTPEDTTVQTPNSDTPYSFVGMDLRAEPIVLTVPQIEKARYFSIQLIDAYTFNFDYIGSRTTGNDGGSYLIAGPNWKGEIPQGIKKVIRAETELIIAMYRTQLFNPSDLDNVKKIQASYKAQPLSSFLSQSAPQAAPPIKFVNPLTPKTQTTSLDFFNVLNFVLGFCPTPPSERELMTRFSKINVGSGLVFDPDSLSPELRKAVQAGMAEAIAELNVFMNDQMTTGRVTSGDLFGTRDYLKNNYLYRYAAAKFGIYGNSKQEALYPFYRKDSEGQLFDASKNNYIMHLAPGQFPPVHAFWSLTMYEVPSSLLSANALNRYLINSPMLPSLLLDADGGITLYIQQESPGKEKEANWLPAPNGPFWCAMRLYWPKQEALNGSWTPPVIRKAQ